MEKITWKITKIFTTDLDNFQKAVTYVAYEVEAEGVTMDSVVKIELNKNNSFINYNDLKEAQIIEWVKLALGSEVEVIESDLMKQIRVKPSSVKYNKTDLPW
jgi:hypothetical protein